MDCLSLYNYAVLISKISEEVATKLAKNVVDNHAVFWRHSSSIPR